MASLKLKLMVAPGGDSHTRRLLRIDRAKKPKSGNEFSLPLSSTSATMFSVENARFMIVPCEESETGDWSPKYSTGLKIVRDKKGITCHV